MVNLARYRWHTGATLRAVDPDEPCPPLFRDVGPVAMARFLERGLTRLAGPYTPLTYLRTASYEEPYTDYENIGRLVLLKPHSLEPWHSGLEHIYVAPAAGLPTPGSLVWVPFIRPLEEGLEDVRDVYPDYALALEDTRQRLQSLLRELAEVEPLTAALRQRLQAGERDEMERLGLDESDLCTAWHHLSRERREWMRHVLG